MIFASSCVRMRACGFACSSTRGGFPYPIWLIIRLIKPHAKDQAPTCQLRQAIVFMSLSRLFITTDTGIHPISEKKFPFSKEI